MALGRRDNNVSTVDRNNTTQIFHKTQKQRPTEVLDYNQIVEPEHRSFFAKNGLRFVMIHCASIIDARRRALALAMVTLNRKRGDFLKIFCSHQLHAISFLPNIQCWWDLKEIKAQIPPDFVQNLLTTGPST